MEIPDSPYMLGYLRDDLPVILSHCPLVCVFVFPGVSGRASGLWRVPSLPKSLHGRVTLAWGTWQPENIPEFFGLVTETPDSDAVVAALVAWEAPSILIPSPTVDLIKHAYERLRHHPDPESSQFTLSGRSAPHGQLSAGAFQALGYRW